jgi:hypothetical protein
MSQIQGVGIALPLVAATVGEHLSWITELRKFLSPQAVQPSVPKVSNSSMNDFRVVTD